MEHKHITPVAVLTMHAVTSLLYFQCSMQTNRNIHLFQEKALTSYPTTKHPKHSKFTITDMREKPADLFYCTAQASTFAPRNNFADLGSFAKVFVFCGTCNFLVSYRYKGHHSKHVPVFIPAMLYILIVSTGMSLVCRKTPAL